MKTDSVQGYHRSLGTDPADLLLQKLQAAGCNTSGPGNGGEYSSQCPAHEDKVASLRWRISADGRALIHCHAGCEGSEIIKALGIKWHQLKPTTVAYEYFDNEGTYLYTVQRTNTVGGTKTFTQFRQGDDGTITDGRGAGPDVLWLAPLLHEWSQDRLGAGDGSLWLVEGEKDVVVSAEWMEDNEFVTTAPGGAGGWKPGHTDAVREVVRASAISTIVLVGDRDAAGVQRLVSLSRVMEAEFPDVSVSMLVPDENTGSDLAAVIDRFRDKWREKLVDASGSELEYFEGTAMTGGLVRMSVLNDKIVLGMVGPDGSIEKAKRALACDLACIDGYDDLGWDLRVTTVGGDKLTVRLARSDCASGTAFNKWLILKAGAARDAAGGVRAESIATALPAFLDWDRRMNNAPYSVFSKHVTWVNADTGEAAHRVYSRMAFLDQDGHPLIYIGPDGPSVKGVPKTGLRWGTEGTEIDAAWAMARVLTFANTDVMTKIAGLIGSVVLAPWLEPYLPIKPGLAIEALSSSGKSTGALSKALALAGTITQSEMTWAAFRRRLGDGVSVIRWLDDSDLLKKEALESTIRNATARGVYEMADVDGGSDSTDVMEFLSGIVITAESIAFLDEIAMVDRFSRSDLPNPQDRMSLYSGRSDRKQWGDVVELNRQWPDLTVLAGHLVKILVDQIESIPGWAEQISVESGIRSEIPYVAVCLGARVMAQALTAVRMQAGSSWPAHGWDQAVYNDWDWLVETADGHLADLRERSTVAGKHGISVPTLVSRVLPLALTADGANPVRQSGNRIVAEIDTGDDPDHFRHQVRERSTRVGLGGGGEGVTPFLLIDQDQRYWVWSSGCAVWYEQFMRGKTKDRVESVGSLNRELKRFHDDPDWASQPASRPGNPRLPGINVRITGQGGKKIVFHRLSQYLSEYLTDSKA